MANRQLELISLIIPNSMAASRRAFRRQLCNFLSAHPQKTKFRGILSNGDAIAGLSLRLRKPAILGGLQPFVNPKFRFYSEIPKKSADRRSSHKLRFSLSLPPAIRMDRSLHWCSEKQAAPNESPAPLKALLTNSFRIRSGNQTACAAARLSQHRSLARQSSRPLSRKMPSTQRRK